MYTVTLDPYDGEFQGPLPAGWTLNANGTASKQVQENTAIGTMPTPIGRWGSAFTDYYKKRSYFDESVPIVGQATIRSDTVVTGNMTGYAQYNTKYIVSGSGPEDDELAKIKERLGISANSGVAEWWIFSERDGKYLINSEDELHWLSYLCATLNWANMDCYPEDLGLPDPLKSHYVLEKDLDMRDYYFMPIGNPLLKNDKDGTIFCEFKGTFDGQGHTISNLHTLDLVRMGGALVGGIYGAGNMFGAIKNATIKNINFENVDIQNEHVALIGIIENSTVENVNVLSGKVIGYYSAAAIASNGHPLSAAYVDGAPVMIGNGNNIFKNCKNYADVSIRTGRNYDNERSNMAAGIFPTHNYDETVSGQTYTANFIGCENHGKIQGYFAAGIAVGGFNDDYYNDELTRNNILFNFSNCNNYGNIQGGFINGGITAGTKGDINNCINYGDKISIDGSFIGDFTGIVRENYGDVNNCINYGDNVYSGIAYESYGNIDGCINTGDCRSGMGMVAETAHGNITKCINMTRQPHMFALSMGEDTSKISVMENCYNFVKFSAEDIIYNEVGVAPFVIMGYNYIVRNCFSIAILDFDFVDAAQLDQFGIQFIPFASMSGERGNPPPEGSICNIENSASCIIIDSPVEFTTDKVVNMLSIPGSGMEAPTSITNSYYYVTCNNNVLYSEIMAEQAAFNKEFIAVKFNAERFGLELRPEIEELIKYLAIPHSLFAIGEGRADAEDAYSKIPVVA